MSSSETRLSRRATLLGALAMLGGCGLTPVYAPGGTGMALRGTVAVGAPDSVEAFRLKDHLEERLGRPETAVYDLAVTLDYTEEPVGVSTGQEITRYTLLGQAGYLLTRIATGEQVSAGEVSTFASYSATGTSVATRAADQDARDRLAIMLADRIVAELLISGVS